MGEKLFELFCITSDSAKYFEECCNLFEYCFTHYDSSN